jgi:uncharacterized protein (DUF2344 family)
MELNNIKMHKENWYALIACICSEKTKSVSQSCSLLGVNLKSEKSEKIIYKEPRFDLDNIKKLYEEIGIVRQMAMKMNVCEATLRKFMKNNGIETKKVKPKISDSFDKNKIETLRKEGKNLKDISLITGYEYQNLNKLIRIMNKEGAVI